MASRMRETLVEVLGEQRGNEMYTMDWLVQRVKWHLDPGASTAAVLVAVDKVDQPIGHTIVRLDSDFEGQPMGLFSTTFVVPECRGQGIARTLLEAGHAWMIEHGMSHSATYTDPGNTPLIRLFKSAGYEQTEIRGEFAVLARQLP